MGEPADVAKAVRAIADGQLDYSTGQVLHVDGGFTCASFSYGTARSGRSARPRALMEKEVTTPEYYPLSLNALVNAANQKSNRDPVVDYDEDTVGDAVDRLR